MKSLVIHGGIEQFKYILRTEEDVMKYHEISAAQNAHHAFDFSKENRVRDVIKDIAEMRGDSMFMTAVEMTNSKSIAILKQVSLGKTIVVNMAGGWCFWDDDMIEITIDDFHDTIIEVKHFSPNMSNGYVYPDVPKTPNKDDIIRLYKTREDLLGRHKYDNYLQWDGTKWCEVCTTCRTKHDTDNHVTQMKRKAQIKAIVY